MTELQAWIDGSCDPNPGGTATYGVILKRNGYTIYSAANFMGRGQRMSNNVAEYGALINLLEWLCEHAVIVDGDEAKHTTIYSDSELLVRQMRRLYRAKKGLYIPYYLRAQRLVASLGQGRLKFVHIPREENEEADTLSKEALRRYT